MQRRTELCFPWRSDQQPKVLSVQRRREQHACQRPTIHHGANCDDFLLFDQMIDVQGCMRSITFRCQAIPVSSLMNYERSTSSPSPSSSSLLCAAPSVACPCPPRPAREDSIDRLMSSRDCSGSGLTMAVTLPTSSGAPFTADSVSAGASDSVPVPAPAPVREVSPDALSSPSTDSTMAPAVGSSLGAGGGGG